MTYSASVLSCAAPVYLPVSTSYCELEAAGALGPGHSASPSGSWLDLASPSAYDNLWIILKNTITVPTKLKKVINKYRIRKAERDLQGHLVKPSNFNGKQMYTGVGEGDGKV